MKRLSFIPLAVLAFTPLTGATAQEQPPPLEPGVRVRVSFDGERRSGTVVALESDTLALQSRRGTLQLLIASVTRLEVSRGRKSFGAGKGALVGLLVGAALGAALDNRRDLGRYQALAEGATVGTLLGAVGGALIKTDRWEEVPLERLSVSFAPQRDGRFALGVSVGF